MTATVGTRRSPSGPRLGDVLLGRGLITAEQLRRGLMTQRSQGLPLGETLVAMGAVAESDLREALSELLGVPAIDLAVAACDPLILDAIPKNKAYELRAIPLFQVDNQLTVAVPDPTNLAKIDELSFVTGKQILPVLALSADVDRHLPQLYGPADADASSDVRFLGQDGAPIDDTVSLEDADVDRPVVRVVNLIIARAIEEQASDIHFEPQDDGMTVRYRVDGRLQVKPFHVPASAVRAVGSRIKILSSLDIAERRRPQDGKIRVRMQGRRIDVRVSTCPNIHGEKIVLRLLDKERQNFTLGNIGMSDELLRRWKRLLLAREGIVLVTGPTGSGKSSTLYATLRHVHDPAVNIVTLEDPVEYELPGISQSQVHEAAGFTFAGGLRSLLRQDPDIILVGEIRDAETARIAIQAALTGHLVLATLHTNDAPSAVTRLVDMGIPAFLVGASLLGVLAQRLVRQVCPSCKQPVGPNPDEQEVFAHWLDAGVPFEDGPGCSRCKEIGYRGRCGAHELLTVDRRLQRRVTAGASDRDIARDAARRGYRPLWFDGLDKVREGVTTLRELARSVGLPEEDLVEGPEHEEEVNDG